VGAALHHTTDNAAEDTAHGATGNAARDTTGHADRNIRFGFFLNNLDSLGITFGATSLPASIKWACGLTWTT